MALSMAAELGLEPGQLIAPGDFEGIMMQVKESFVDIPKHIAAYQAFVREYCSAIDVTNVNIVIFLAKQTGHPVMKDMFRIFEFSKTVGIPFRLIVNYNNDLTEDDDKVKLERLYDQVVNLAIPSGKGRVSVFRMKIISSDAYVECFEDQCNADKGAEMWRSSTGHAHWRDLTYRQGYKEGVNETSVGRIVCREPVGARVEEHTATQAIDIKPGRFECLAYGFARNDIHKSVAKMLHDATHVDISYVLGYYGVRVFSSFTATPFRNSLLYGVIRTSDAWSTYNKDYSNGHGFGPVWNIDKDYDRGTFALDRHDFSWVRTGYIDIAGDELLWVFKVVYSGHGRVKLKGVVVADGRFIAVEATHLNDVELPRIWHLRLTTARIVCLQIMRMCGIKFNKRAPYWLENRPPNILMSDQEMPQGQYSDDEQEIFFPVPEGVDAVMSIDGYEGRLATADNRIGICDFREVYLHCVASCGIDHNLGRRLKLLTPNKKFPFKKFAGVGAKDYKMGRIHEV